MSDDGLSFDGIARLSGEDWRWDGERIPEPPPANALDPQRKWYAAVLCLRSKARLRQGMGEDALTDAVEAARIAMYLPDAWDAIATAALAIEDKRTATIALAELWYRTSAGDSSGGDYDAARGGMGMPQALKDRRREQGFMRDELSGGIKKASDVIVLEELQRMMRGSGGRTAQAAVAGEGVVVSTGTGATLLPLSPMLPPTLTHALTQQQGAMRFRTRA